MVRRVGEWAVAAVPDGLVAAGVHAVARFPARLAVSARQGELLAPADPFSFGPGRVGWAFGAGPAVVLVHGWAGSAAQMAPLAARCADAGFRGVTFDVRGHGRSARRPVSFADFGRDLARVIAVVGDPVALVGHSAGALCMMAARTTHNVRAGTYVCLAAPKGPYPPVDEIRKLVGDRTGVLQRSQEWWSRPLGGTWNELSRGAAYAHHGQGRLLAVNDANDPVVSPGDAEAITAGWPHAERLTTTGLGHRKMLWDQAVGERITHFIQAN